MILNEFIKEHRKNEEQEARFFVSFAHGSLTNRPCARSFCLLCGSSDLTWAFYIWPLFHCERFISLCDCRVESKRHRIRCVKYWKAMLAISTALFVSIALAEDFKTINGKEYKDATITRVEGDGIVLRTKTGISKVYFVELPQDIQKRFHYGPATPSAAQRQPIELEPKQDGRRQADRGGRVVVVGQGALSWKVIVAGIVVLVGEVLAVVRSRF